MPAPWCHPGPEWHAQTPSISTKFSCHFLDVDSVLSAGGRSDHTLKSLVSSSKGSRHTPQRQPWSHDRGRCCKQVQADQRGAVLLQLETIRRLTWGKSFKGLALSLDRDAGQCDAEWRRAIGNTQSTMAGKQDHRTLGVAIVENLHRPSHREHFFNFHIPQPPPQRHGGWLYLHPHKRLLEMFMLPNYKQCNTFL